MPDKYGRFSMEDGVRMGAGISAIANQAKLNRLYDEKLAGIGREKESREQVGLGLTALQGGATERPDNITPQNWIKSQGWLSEGAGYADNAAKYKESDAIRTATNSMIPVLEQNNYDFSAIKPRNSAEVAARANLVQSYSTTEQGRNLLHKNMGERLTRQFSEFQAHKGEIDRLLQEGKTDEALKGIELLSQKAPLPYSLNGFDPKTQTFAVNYLDSKKGQTPTGERMPMKDVWQMISGMDEKQFFTQGVQHAAAVRLDNFQKQSDPTKHLYAKGKKDGKSYTIVSQKNPYDLTDLDYLVVSDDGQEQVIRSMAEVKKYFKIENLDREGKRASIASTKQSTATAETHQGLYAAQAEQVGKDAVVKRRKEALDQSDKRLTMQLKLLAGAKNSSGVNIFEAGENGEVDANALLAAVLGGGKASIPVIEGIVRALNDPEMSIQTKDVARAALQEIQRRGDIQPVAETPQSVAPQETIKRARDKATGRIVDFVLRDGQWVPYQNKGESK